MSKKTTSTLRALFSWKMLVMLALGFASGVPFLVTKDVIKAWLTDAQVPIETIGLFSAVSVPYTFKFLWSPLMDRFTPPFLGRRRGWILVTQIALLVAIATLGQFNPQNHLQIITFVCMAIAFFSASQDIVLDAFRREFLSDEEIGLGTGIWINAYRLANLATVGVSFALADKIGYDNVHLILAAMMGVGIVTVFLAPEPKVDTPPPRSLREAVIEPFAEFFKRQGAWLILAFLLLYKIGDNMASAMNVPFVLQLGFEKTDYFLIVKGIGLASLFFGMFLGGLLMVRIGINRALWIFGFLQMAGIATFAILANVGKNHLMLTIAVVAELLTMGLGTTAYASFMAIQTNKRFTATQYALMSSLMAVPSTLVAALTGYLVKSVGWAEFYWICVLCAVPGTLLLVKIAPWNGQQKKT